MRSRTTWALLIVIGVLSGTYSAVRFRSTSLFINRLIVLNRMNNNLFSIAVYLHNYNRIKKVKNLHEVSIILFLIGTFAILLGLGFKEDIPVAVFVYAAIIISPVYAITKALKIVYKIYFKPYVIIDGKPVVPKTIIDNSQTKELNKYTGSYKYLYFSDYCNNCLYKANCIAGPGEPVIQCNKFRHFNSYNEIRTCY